MRKIALGHLQINENGRKYVNDALDGNRLSSGKYTNRFEREFAKLHQCRHGIFCNSGTSALHISLAALKELYGYQDNDEVIVPATTFVATSNVVLQNNLKPVFVDVDPLTFNIDAVKIEQKITKRTRCIIPVHLFGLPADMPSICRIASVYNLNILEDSCECVSATVNGEVVGSFGELACFSQYIAHHIVGGVGGMVTTNNEDLMKICRSLIAHGRDSIYTNIDQDDSIDQQMIERRFRFERVGYSYRATELEAAIALSELEQWEFNVVQRSKNANILVSLLADLQLYLQLPRVPWGYEHTWMMFPMVLREYFFPRDRFLLYLEEHGIETRYLFPLLDQPVYQKLFPDLGAQYRVSQHLSRNGFFVGCHQHLNLDDMKYVSDVIHSYFDSSDNHVLSS